MKLQQKGYIWQYIKVTNKLINIYAEIKICINFALFPALYITCKCKNENIEFCLFSSVKDFLKT